QPVRARAGFAARAFFFQAEDGIRDFHVTEFRRVLFRSKAASDVLRRAGKPDAIDGYKAGERGRVWELASAIWSAVAGLRLSYAPGRKRGGEGQGGERGGRPVS